MDLAGGAFGDGIERRQARQPPRELVQPAHRAHAARRDLRLLAHAAGQRRADHGDDQKNHRAPATRTARRW